MQWICCLWFIGSLVLFVWASFDFKKSTVNNRCDQISCYQGVCSNGTCVCKLGWTGAFCESCTGRIKLNGSSGFVIDSPFNYSKNLRCTWLLVGWESVYDTPGALTLTVDSFATECGWDHLYIYDGDGIYSKQLAALSGVLTPRSDTKARQYVAESGRAYLFFYSDLAYNMSGFNVSYRWDRCPNQCSGNGICLPNGVCNCTDNWSGKRCDKRVCSSACYHGNCTKQGICECESGFVGPYCNISTDNDAWYTVNSDGPGARSSHAMVIVDDDIFVVGGYQFVGTSDTAAVAKYSFNRNEWANLSNGSTVDDEASVPLLRYDHSLVHHKDQGVLYMYGGVIKQKNITDELWTFNLTDHTWSLVSSLSPPGPDDTTEYVHLSNAPMAAAGHTAHIIQCGNVRSDRMVVLFGYNPYFGYLSVVQEYFFENQTWSIAKTNGARVIGTYGHSSVYEDEQTKWIFFYGGIFSSTQTVGQITDRLFAYDPCKRQWSVLRSSNYASFLHSAVILNRLMIVVGGNAHNESLKATECYSQAVLAYDIDCGQWRVLDYPNYLISGLARYGHKAVVHKGAMYVFGGFNGGLLDDVIKFIPNDCSTNRDSDACANSHRGAKCAFVKNRCMSYTDAQQTVANEKLSSTKLDKSCEYSGIGTAFECLWIRDCDTCVTNGIQPCQWCNGQCQSDCSLVSTTESSVTSISGCPAVGENCPRYHTCYSCRLHDDKCTWGRNKSQYSSCAEKTSSEIRVEKLPSENAALAILAKDPINLCPPPCSRLYDCESCAASGCLWCSPLERCVDMNAYLTSFPYGQCIQWSTTVDQCEETSPCSTHLTCNSCHSAGPRCGWCDDGNGKGLGECMEGIYSGAVDIVDGETYSINHELCPRDRWYFVDCPACQCNGHSTCLNISETQLEPGQQLPCESCDKHYIGDHCEKCNDGYWGNALNGGNCTACECNSQATNCNPLTGKCYCTTKGVSGHTCDKCDQKYIGDPRNQTCFYELAVDFVFTFNLNNEDDLYITKINFVARPLKENTDVTFKLTCAQGSGLVGKVNLTVGQVDNTMEWKYRRFLAGAACHDIERKFGADEFQFGTSANITFFVFLYEFHTPISITVSFAQTPTIDWMKFFVTFALCFFILLVIAFALWKIKQRVDIYRRRQRMFVEMAQMASRPFGSLQLELTNVTGGQRQFATPISVEPCGNYRAGAVTVAVRLPTGGKKFAPAGQAGLAVASTLCLLTASQLAQLQTPPSPLPEQKRKRKRPSCMS